MKSLLALIALCAACSSNHPSDKKVTSASDKFKSLQKAATPNLAEQNNPDRQRLLCFADDISFEEAEAALFKQLEDSILKGQFSNLHELLSSDYKGSSFSINKVVSKKDLGEDISYTTFSTTDHSLDKKRFSQDLKNYYKQFKSLKNVRLEASHYKILKSQRLSDMKPFEILADINLDLKGIGVDGKLREDRALLKARASKVNGKWLLNSLNFNELLSFSNSNPHFSELKLADAGLDSMKSYERLEAIRRGGYTLALSDFNADSNTDFLLGSFGKLQLYKGKGDGTFSEVKDSGLEAHTLVKSAVWADLNNNGLKDLLIVRFVDMSSEHFGEYLKTESDETREKIDHNKTPKLNSVVIYKNLGNGKFKKASELSDGLPTEHAMPATIADFNNDGFLDIYIGYPGVKDFTTFTQDAKAKRGKKAQGVYLNDGKMNFFAKAMNKTKKYEVFSEENMIYPHSSIAVDYNQDGHVDIVVVDDRGNLSVAYKNIGNAEFEIDNKAMGFQNYGIGMGLAVGDVNNDGKVDMALSNIAFNQRNRMARSCALNWGQAVTKDEDLQVRSGLRLFQSMSGKKFKDQTALSGLTDVGDGLGGVEFLDYNNDGLQDIYVTNGLWSGTDKSFDLSGTFNRALRHQVEEGIYEGPVTTRSFMMDILANYRNEKGEAPSMAGFQSNKLFRNLGNGKFMEVGYLEGVDSIADGYVVGTADVNNDGVIDIILRNADPGTKLVSYPPVQIYLGKKSTTKSIQITLEGHISNRDAIGAELIASVNGMPIQVRQMIANNGTIQSEQKLWFSLGKESSMKELKIRWPNGRVQVLKNLKPGKHHIVEGNSLAATN
jgi:hypothetical protein